MLDRILTMQVNILALVVLRYPVGKQINRQTNKQLVELLHPIFLFNILSRGPFISHKKGGNTAIYDNPKICLAKHDCVSERFANSNLAQTPHFVHGKLEVQRWRNGQNQDTNPGGLILSPLWAQCLCETAHSQNSSEWSMFHFNGSSANGSCHGNM